MFTAATLHRTAVDEGLPDLPTAVEHAAAFARATCVPATITDDTGARWTVWPNGHITPHTAAVILARIAGLEVQS